MRSWMLGLVVMMAAGCENTGAEICDNGVDDDGDGLVDCEEALCRCSTTEICDGGIDEDDDGLTDCADPDCDGVDACIEDLCDDGLDDDADGLIDCLDPDCDGGCPEVCDDGRDNDGNGLTDCEDATCVDEDVCGELLCDDGTDDDGDGLVDCADDDCWGLACHPSGIRTEITGGSMVLADIDRFVRSSTGGYYTSYVSGAIVDIDCGTGSTNSTSSTRSELRLENIQGVARVQVGDATETCDFSFPALTVDGNAGAFTPGERADFTIQDASRCRLAGTSWMPRTLTRDGNAVNAGVITRYAMANPMSRQGTTSARNTTTFQPSCYRYFNTYGTASSVYGDNVSGDEVLVTP